MVTEAKECVAAASSEHKCHRKQSTDRDGMWERSASARLKCRALLQNVEQVMWKCSTFCWADNPSISSSEMAVDLMQPFASNRAGGRSSFLNEPIVADRTISFSRTFLLSHTSGLPCTGLMAHGGFGSWSHCRMLDKVSVTAWNTRLLRGCGKSECMSWLDWAASLDRHRK